jgi:hypothetical protein
MTKLYTTIPGLDHTCIDGQWTYTSQVQLELFPTEQLENVRSAAPSSEHLLGSSSKSRHQETSSLLPNKGSWTEEKWIQRKGKPYGPYLYRRWREDGRLRSQYLGKLHADGTPKISQKLAGDRSPGQGRC